MFLFYLYLIIQLMLKGKTLQNRSWFSSVLSIAILLFSEAECLDKGYSLVDVGLKRPCDSGYDTPCDKNTSVSSMQIWCKMYRSGALIKVSTFSH